MAIDDDDDDDRVGYGKPPKHTRFRSGQSGNPRGRARAVDFKDWENPIQKYMLELITVTVKGKKEKMPVVDALIKTTIRRALEGCTKHLKILLDGSGGLTALIQQQKRQITKAEEELIERARKELHAWVGDSTPANNARRDEELGDERLGRGKK
jgi:hypothetical protein